MREGVGESASAFLFPYPSAWVTGSRGHQPRADAARNANSKCTWCVCHGSVNVSRTADGKKTMRRLRPTKAIRSFDPTERRHAQYK